MHRAAHAAAPARWFDMTYRSGVVVATGSSLTYPLLPETMRIVAGVTGGLARDVFMAGAHSGTSLGVAFGVWLKECRRPTAVERTRWSCISAHLGAGMRLRAATRRLPLDSAPVEAVLDSGGRVQHARAGAASVGARELLREAVRPIEKARTTEGRRDPDAAMDSWEGLVDGRWSLVDRFDTDGKRFVVAVQNDPAHPDPRGLTMCEREVAEFVGLGRSTKEIGYILGVSLSAVTNLTARAQDKLGLTSRAERRSYLLIDGAQLVPGTFIDFRSLGADYLAFSFHKMLAPFGVGVLVAREPLLEASPPFLYGGDMIAEGEVFADRVAYNTLPWKYTAGTPNIIGTIVSAQALRLLLRPGADADAGRLLRQRSADRTRGGGARDGPRG
jgi:DNA-binding CsgD family transcriptional regulator